MMEKKGKCLCGAITFTATDPDPSLGACHCGMCQKWSGSALVTTCVKQGALQIDGEENLTRFKSSDWGTRVFCSKCGSSLFYEVTAPGKHFGERYLPVGLFDDTQGMKLEHEIFYDRRIGAFEYGNDTKKLSEAETLAQFTGG